MFEVQLLCERDIASNIGNKDTVINKKDSLGQQGRQ
jgi:hypothetical protein